MGHLRFLLAVAVVRAHTAGFPDVKFISGQLAVQLFYVISGFLITVVLTAKYPPTWCGTRRFYASRWLRIWVPYLAVGTITILAMKIIPLLGGHALGGSSLFSLKALRNLEPSVAAAALFANVFIFGQDIGLWLAHEAGRGLYWTSKFMAEPMPFATFYVMDQSWTLGIELTFYVIAPFVVRRSWGVIAFILALSMAARLAATASGLGHDPWSYRFFPFELALFMTGCLAAKLYLALRGFKAPWMAVAGSVPILAVVAWPYLPIPLPSALLFLSVSLFLPFLFAWTARNPWDSFVGSLSYPLYLVHVPVILVIRSHPVPSEWFGTVFPIVLSLSLLAALAVVRWVENPVDRYRARRFGVSSA